MVWTSRFGNQEQKATKLVTLPAPRRVSVIMSSHVRPTLAALLGAAALSASSPAAAETTRRDQTELAHACELLVAESTSTKPEAPAAEPASLRTLIENRIAHAEREHRYDDIDELTTLWLTLERREQLDRVVDRGQQFLNVSLRNQKRSELRSASRRQRFAPYDAQALDVPGPSWTVDQSIDAERFVSHLSEPYRSAVLWTLTGRNHREVADEMQVSHAAVRKWAQRLRERLDGDPLQG
ncbi:MAG TPA: hypothetical protein ENK57_22440 [Polyangiaceae bacterium]|nr:hypothetical protein [Polyangiaceae bacterium]